MGYTRISSQLRYHKSFISYTLSYRSPGYTTTDYTGNSALLLPPAALSNALRTYGPTTGIFPANCPMVTRKSPNRMNSPYSSIRNPVNGHRHRIRMIPAANAAVPRSFCRREKKASVFWKPIISVRPIRKRIYVS